MYLDEYSEEIVKKLIKLNKKDKSHYLIVRKKIDFILSNPKHTYKNLTHSMKCFKRVHIGHFVLIFIVDDKNKIISFEDYDHHDKIYQEGARNEKM